MATSFPALLRSRSLALFAASLFGICLTSSCTRSQSGSKAEGDTESSEAESSEPKAGAKNKGKPSGKDKKKDSDSAKKGESTKGSSTQEPTTQEPGGEESDPGKEDDEGGDNGPKFDVANPDIDVDVEIGCDVDFLFIVDNSDSMTVNQKYLANSVPEFIKTITSDIKNLESYHIGVISTDENRYNHNDAVGDKCATLGGLIVRTVDHSKYPFATNCTPYANGKHFMTNDDDLSDKFQCAANLGDDGSGYERPMDAMRAAFSEDLGKPGACNEGFFRKDAVLVVVLVTDEEDDREHKGGTDMGSQGEPEDWYKDLLKFKGDRPEYVVVLSLQGLAEPNDCEWTYEPGGEYKKGMRSAEVSLRLKAFAEKFGKRGLVGDVCSENYKPFFDKAVSVINLACNELPG